MHKWEKIILFMSLVILLFYVTIDSQTTRTVSEDDEGIHKNGGVIFVV